MFLIEQPASNITIHLLERPQADGLDAVFGDFVHVCVPNLAGEELQACRAFIFVNYQAVVGINEQSFDDCADTVA